MAFLAGGTMSLLGVCTCEVSPARLFRNLATQLQSTSNSFVSKTTDFDQEHTLIIRIRTIQKILENLFSYKNG